MPTEFTLREPTFGELRASAPGGFSGLLSQASDDALMASALEITADDVMDLPVSQHTSLRQQLEAFYDPDRIAVRLTPALGDSTEPRWFAKAPDGSLIAEVRDVTVRELREFGEHQDTWRLADAMIAPRSGELNDQPSGIMLGALLAAMERFIFPHLALPPEVAKEA